MYTAGVSDRPSIGTARSPTRVAVSAEALVSAVERANTEQDRSDLSPWRVGTYQCGINLLQETWQRTSLVFEVKPTIAELKECLPRRPSSATWSGTPQQAPANLLTRYPIDILVVDHSCDLSEIAIFGKGERSPPCWYEWLKRCPTEKRPTAILQYWQPGSMLSSVGPLSKPAQKSLEQMGFETRYQLVDAESCGSPVSQARLIIWSFSRRASRGEREWFVPTSELPPRPTRDEREWCVPTSDLPPRPMSNCLRPFGARHNQDSCPVTNKNDVPDAATDPMPSKCGAWIRTTAGYRRLYADELAKGLGVPSTWSEVGRCSLKARHLSNLVGIHLWEAVGLSVIKFLGEHLKPPPRPMGPEVSPVKADIRSPTGDLHL
jgi:hypothetical protein